MLQVTKGEFENYLYIKLQLKKAGIYRALFNRAEIFFQTEDFTEDSCVRFLSSLGEISNSTYNNYLKALKHLSHLLGYTFLDTYKQKKTEAPYIEVLEEHEMVGLLETAYSWDYRRALALELFLRTGLRANELISLEWKDYHITRIFIKKTKTSRSRIVEILPDLSEKIEKLRGHHPRYIFATHKGQLNRARFNQFLTKIVAERRINKYITAHKLRHSYATLCADKGISHFVIQDMLGHSSLDTTRGYIHTTATMKRNAAKKVSLGKYQLSHKETVTEISRYIDSFPSGESEIVVVRDGENLTIKVRKKPLS